MAASALGTKPVSAGAADPLITDIQDWNQVLGEGVDAAPYGMPSEFEKNVVRRDVAWLTADSKVLDQFYPLA